MIDALVKKVCINCRIERNFLVESLRDKLNICGQCWKWHLSDEENQEKVFIKILNDKTKS